MPAVELEALRQPGRVDGIDLSRVQGDVDWQRVAAAGFEFAVVKASEGTSYCDPRALEYLAGARAAGLYTLTYAFARPSQDRPADQARRLYECSGDTMPARAVLDLESGPDGWSPERIVAFAEAFADAWREVSALEAIVYSYDSFVRHRLGAAIARSTRLARCPYWPAVYRSTTVAWAPSPLDKPPVAPPWKDWALWQYSGDGGYRVPGVAVDCDRDLFHGDRAALRRFFGFADSSPPEPTAIIHPKVPFGRAGDDDDEPDPAA